MKKFLLPIFFFALLFLAKSAQAANIDLTPSSGSFAQGSTFTVTVKISSEEAINTAEATIGYSTNTLELIGVSQGSTFYLPALNSPTKGAVSAYFGGGLPSPGYTGSSGILGTMTFRAKALGPATLTVTRGKTLLNDGNGTNSLINLGSTKFTIIPPPLPGPVVTSETHPLQDIWYSDSNLELTWERSPDAYGFSLVLDRNPDTTPDDELDTTVTTKASYQDLRDGVWYFHIKARRGATGPFGAVTHFRIQIDTEPPSLFEINVIGQTDLKDISRTPTVTFEAEDTTSGINHYDVFVDNDVAQEKTNSPYAFEEKIEAGPHVIKVTAFDRAGNFRSAQLPIIVSGPAVIGYLQSNLNLPVYILIIINVIILLIILFFVWYYRKSQKTRLSKEISKVQGEIDASLENLKGQISDRLTILSSKERVEKEVQKDIKKAKKKFKKIDTEIEHLGETTKKTKRSLKK